MVRIRRSLREASSEIPEGGLVGDGDAITNIDRGDLGGGKGGLTFFFLLQERALFIPPSVSCRRSLPSTFNVLAFIMVSWSLFIIVPLLLLCSPLTLLLPSFFCLILVENAGVLS